MTKNIEQLEKAIKDGEEILRKSQMGFDFSGSAHDHHVAYTRTSKSGAVSQIKAKGAPKVEIKKVSSSEANVSQRHISYDVYHDGKYETTYQDVNDALDHKDRVEKGSQPTKKAQQDALKATMEHSRHAFSTDKHADHQKALEAHKAAHEKATDPEIKQKHAAYITMHQAESHVAKDKPTTPKPTVPIVPKPKASATITDQHLMNVASDVVQRLKNHPAGKHADIHGPAEMGSGTPVAGPKIAGEATIANWGDPRSATDTATLKQHIKEANDANPGMDVDYLVGDKGHITVTVKKKNATNGY